MSGARSWVHFQIPRVFCPTTSRWPLPAPCQLKHWQWQHLSIWWRYSSHGVSFYTWYFVYNCFYTILTFAKTILETSDIWDTDWNSDNWEPEFVTICVTWQLRVTLDSIRNSCDVCTWYFLAMFTHFSWCISLHCSDQCFLSLGSRSFTPSDLIWWQIFVKLLIN